MHTKESSNYQKKNHFPVIEAKMRFKLYTKHKKDSASKTEGKRTMSYSRNTFRLFQFFFSFGHIDHHLTFFSWWFNEFKKNWWPPSSRWITPPNFNSNDDVVFSLPSGFNNLERFLFTIRWVKYAENGRRRFVCCSMYGSRRSRRFTTATRFCWVIQSLSLLLLYSTYNTVCNWFIKSQF